MGIRGRIIGLGVASSLIAAPLVAPARAQIEDDSKFGHIVISGSHSARTTFVLRSAAKTGEVLFSPQWATDMQITSKGSYGGAVIQDSSGHAVFGFVAPTSWNRSAISHIFTAGIVFGDFDANLRAGRYTVTLLGDGETTVRFPLSTQDEYSLHPHDPVSVRVSDLDLMTRSLPTLTGSASGGLHIGPGAVVGDGRMLHWSDVASQVPSVTLVDDVELAPSTPPPSRSTRSKPRDSEETLTTEYPRGELQPGDYTFSAEILTTSPVDQMRAFAIAFY